MAGTITNPKGGAMPECIDCAQEFLDEGLDEFGRCLDCRHACYACGASRDTPGMCPGCQRCVECGRRSEHLSIDLVCGRCLATCPGCGRAEIISRLIDGICPSCSIPPASRINIWNYRPSVRYYDATPKYHTAPKTGTFYIGAEVEMEIKRKHSRAYVGEEIKLKDGGPWYIKTDSSIDYGIEVVSHPVSIDRWRTKRDLFWLMKARKLGCRAYDTTTCGLHFHVARRHFTKMHLWKLLTMLAKHREWLVNVSQREPQNMTRYTKPDELNDLIDARAILKKSVSQEGTRYEAVNVTNPNTIEFRFFRGTLASGGFLRNMDWLVALIAFTRGAVRGQLTPKHFHRWLTSPQSVPYIGRDSAKLLSTWSEERMPL